MVFEQQPTDTRSVRPRSDNRMLIFSWVLGTFTGVVISSLLFLATYSLGYVSFRSTSAPASLSAAVVVESPTPTDCPECTPTATETGAAQATETPTPAPSQEIQSSATPFADFAATATQACATFHNRFPGTPCPRFRTPTPSP
jgi:hypothetical protein